MSILDNTRLMVKVCKLCYEENMSQAEVSEKLHISKPQVSRIINAAREKGILNIYISNPFAEDNVHSSWKALCQTMQILVS